MAKATRIYNISKSTISPPVSLLAEQLLALWDADDASSREQFALGDTERKMSETSANRTSHQISEWREAIELLISFSPATNLHEALIQLALASDAARDVAELWEQEEVDERLILSRRLMLDRLLDSAISVMRKNVSANMTCESIVKIYAVSEAYPPLIALVPAWAEQGRRLRKPGSAG